MVWTEDELWPRDEAATTRLWKAFDDVTQWVVGSLREAATGSDDIYTSMHDYYISHLSPTLFDQVRKEVERIESLQKGAS